MKFSKLKSSPSHFIDTSVILGAFSEEEKFYEDCRSYLSYVGYRYRGFISASVVGELFVVMECWEDFFSRNLFLDFFEDIVHRYKIHFIPTNFQAFDIIRKIRNLDYRVEAADSEHLSVAISRDADRFVTPDKVLLHNGSLESEFKIHIVHPKEMWRRDLIFSALEP